MTNPYTGLPLTEADRYLGEPGDFGDRWCHGCNANCTWGDSHWNDCPKKCVDPQCGYHFYIVPLVDKLP